jgi:hypothetical protein
MRPCGHDDELTLMPNVPLQPFEIILVHLRGHCIQFNNITLPIHVLPAWPGAALARSLTVHTVFFFYFFMPLRPFPNQTPRTLTRCISPSELPVTASIGRGVSFLVPYRTQIRLVCSRRQAHAAAGELETNKQTNKQTGRMSREGSSASCSPYS